MKKTLKALVLMTFCICMIMSTMITSSAVGKVTGAKATNITYNSATLTWSKAKNADGYEVQQYKSKKWTTIKKIESGSTVSYKVSKLTTGTTYKYRVRAYEKTLLNRFKYSDYVNISVKPMPAKVTGLKASSGGYNSVKLTWSKVSGATGYVVQWYKNKKWVDLKKTKSNSLTVTGLTTDTTYSFRVRAYRTVSKKNHYGSYSATVKGTPKLAATSSIKLSGETTTSATLTWSKVSGATGYQVYNPTTKKWVNVKTKLTYTIKSLKANTKYTAKVRAYRKSGSKTYYGTEKSVSFVTMPAALKSFKISSYNTSSIKISWSKASNIKSYRVFIYDYSTKKETKYDTTSTSYTFKNLKPGTKYRVSARAYAKNTNNIYGEKLSLTVTLPKLTDVPVSWSAVSGATKYKVERYNPATFDWDAIKETTGTAYTDTLDVNSGGLYRISAYNGDNFISSVLKEASNAGITLSKATNKITVTWKKPSTDSAVKYYAVFEKPRKGSDKTDEELVYAIDTADTKETFFTAYGTEQTYVIYAVHGVYLTSPDRTKVAEFTVRAENLKIDSTDTSKNGQILKLVDAINRTKYDQNKVTVTQNSSIAVNVDNITMDSELYLAMVGMSALDSSISIKGFSKNKDTGKYECKGAQNISDFMSGISGEATTADEINTKTTINETVTFNNGNGYSTENSQYVYLKKYIEPSGTEPFLASLYNGSSVSKWDEGFSSVTTTVLDNGNYSFTGTIKAETFGTQVKSDATAANYHSGFTSSFDGLNFGTDGMDNLKTTVSASKITAEYTPDGKLVTYSIGKTTIDMVFETRVTNGMAMGMEMSGDCTLSYSFKR